MNIKMIKAFKEEFDYFIKHGENSIIACEKQYLERDGWELNVAYLFDSIGLKPEKYLIVKNDKYVELRKEAALGKQMQVSYDSGRNWNNKLTKKITWSDSQLVRVKPDELKIGEYVVCIKDIFSYSGHGWIRKGEILPHQKRASFEDQKIDYNEYFERWKPIVGEMYIMKSDYYSKSITIQKWEENAKWIPIPIFPELNKILGK